MVWLWIRLWICLYLFNSLEGTSSWAFTPSVNNIYAMYIMLYESLISILLLFKSIYKKAKKPKDEKILWTRRCNVNKLFKEWRHARPSKWRGKNLSFLEQNTVSLKDVLSTCPTHGRGNAPHVQPMDEEMHKQVRTCWLRRQNNPTCGRAKGVHLMVKIN